MGKKTLWATMVLTVASVSISSACLFLPFHQMIFSLTIPFGSLFKLTTYISSVRTSVNSQSNAFCAGMKAMLNREWEMCKQEGDKSLQETAQMWCQPQLEKAFPKICAGMSAAAPIGLAFVTFSIIAFILQIAGASLALMYVTSSPKKKYRDVAQLLYAISFAITFVLQLLYFFFVLRELDSVDAKLLGGLGQAFEPITVGKGNGISLGWWLNWLSILTQVVTIILYQFAKSGDEVRLAEAREFDRFVQEVEMHNQGMGKHAGAGGAPPLANYGPWGGPPISPGGFQCPPGPQQPAFGLGMATTAPPPGWGAPGPQPAVHSGGQGPPYF